jgi:aspartate-semialdehyde dehydrogenase
MNIAIIGLEGLVAKTFLKVLEQENFSAVFYFISTEPRKEKFFSFKKKKVPIFTIPQFDFSATNLVVFLAGTDIAKHYAPLAKKAGNLVIDISSAFRDDPKVPLIIPAVNGQSLAKNRVPSIIASPNCTTTQLLSAIYPIEKKSGLKQLNITTYQSVSGSGIAGIETLTNEVMAWSKKSSVKKTSYDYPIAFNVFPHIDDLLDNGYTQEEMRLINEAKKILNNKKLSISATCVRVPVLFGHSLAVTLETKRTITLAALKKLLQKTPGVIYCDDIPVPTPLESFDQSCIFVGRLHKDLHLKNTFHLWIVADNVKRGIVMNVIEILKLLDK